MRARQTTGTSRHEGARCWAPPAEVHWKGRAISTTFEARALTGNANPDASWGIWPASARDRVKPEEAALKPTTAEQAELDKLLASFVRDPKRSWCACLRPTPRPLSGASHPLLGLPLIAALDLVKEAHEEVGVCDVVVGGLARPHVERLEFERAATEAALGRVRRRAHGRHLGRVDVGTRSRLPDALARRPAGLPMSPCSLMALAAPSAQVLDVAQRTAKSESRRCSTGAGARSTAATMRPRSSRRASALVHAATRRCGGSGSRSRRRARSRGSSRSTALPRAHLPTRCPHRPVS